jgi:hypothetical protein
VAISRSAALNWSKIVGNVESNVELQPAACFLDAKWLALPDVSDDWLIIEADDARLKIQNVRTGQDCPSERSYTPLHIESSSRH